MWHFPDKNIGAGCHFLLQGTFPTQGSNLHLLNCRKILYHLSHQGSAIAIHMSPVFFGFPSHLADHRALSSIPSAVQSVPISHRFYTEYQYWPCVNSNFSIPPTSPPFFGFWFLLLSLPYSLRRRALAPLLSTSRPRFTCNGSQCPSALRPLHPHQPGFLPVYPLLFFPSWSHGLRRFCTPQIFISQIGNRFSPLCSPAI